MKLKLYNRDEIFLVNLDTVLYLKSATIIQYTIKGRFMSR